MRIDPQDLLALTGQLSTVAVRIRRDHQLGRDWYDLTGIVDHMLEVAKERQQMDAALEPVKS